MFDLSDTFPTKLILPEDPLPCFFGDTGGRVILTVLVNTQLFKASDFCKPWDHPSVKLSPKEGNCTAIPCL